MKKLYIEPVTNIIIIGTVQMLAASGDLQKMGITNEEHSGDFNAREFEFDDNE